MEPIVPPFVPVLLAALLLPVVGRKLGHALGIVAGAAVVPYVWLVEEGAHMPAELFGFEVVLFNVDGFSTVLGLIFGFITAGGVLYSWASEADSRQTAIALTYVASSLGAAFGGDWLTLLFFWELMAVTSTLLVWYYGGKAVRAGFRYALLHGIGGTLMLAAVVVHYVEVGSFLFSDATGLAGSVAPVLGALGAGVNVGFIGLHAWLPDTYPRPHIAASVFLSAYTTKIGVYGLYRVFPDEGGLAIAYMGGLMTLFGAAMALFQNDMRRLLSYHIQAQVGYMVAGIGIGGALGQAGAFAHLFNNILYKGLLFMVAGVVVYRTGKESLKKLGGLASEMPITAGMFTIAALSIAGFPGFNGFVSKGIVIYASHYDLGSRALIELGGRTGLEWVLLLGGVGTFMSFIKFGYYAFFHGEYDGEVKDANRGQTAAMGVVAAACVLFGVYPDAQFAILPFDVTDEAVVSHVYHTYTVTHLLEGVGLAVAGLIGFRLVKKPLSGLGRVPDVDNLYNPATFYGTRYLVVGVTELYARVDDAAVALAKLSVQTAKEPEAALARATGRESVETKADIERSLLLVLATLVAAMALLLV